jgi:hypothetical protein
MKFADRDSKEAAADWAFCPLGTQVKRGAFPATGGPSRSRTQRIERKTAPGVLRPFLPVEFRCVGDGRGPA